MIKKSLKKFIYLIYFMLAKDSVLKLATNLS
jgi:hypothetical protein